MSENKVMGLLFVGFFTTIIVLIIFGDASMFDSESTKKFKESEKTKQLQYQFKIDSLKVIQKK